MLIGHRLDATRWTSARRTSDLVIIQRDAYLQDQDGLGGYCHGYTNQVSITSGLSQRSDQGLLLEPSRRGEVQREDFEGDSSSG